MEVRRRTAETVKQEDSDPVHESPVKSIEDLNDDHPVEETSKVCELIMSNKHLN